MRAHQFTPERATKVIVILADDEIDIIQEDCRELNEHCRDLREMGCTVKRKVFTSWEAAEQFEDNHHA